MKKTIGTSPFTFQWRLLVSTFSILPAILLAQGNLTPPGAPAATMKTLDQIEPRIDVAKLPGDVGSHVIISNAGSYYLSANLEVTKTNGITIAAAGVTLDLNGFEIARVSGSGGDGIRINGGSDRATVRNGTIRGFSFGVDGNPGPYSKGCLFEQLAVTGCSAYGIFAGETARVLDCRAQDNPGIGIYAWVGSIISGCTAQGNQGYYGIAGYIGATISGCTAYGNVGTGAFSYGIFCYGAGTITACVSRNNSNTNSPGNPSLGVGIYADSGSTVKDCTVSNNKGDGIQIGNNCLVVGNNCSFNGFNGDGAGIHSTSARNRIEANTVTSNDRGIDVDSTASLILCNSASNNGTNYVIAANNKVGTIVLAPNSVAISGDTGGAGVGSTDPWANFTH